MMELSRSYSTTIALDESVATLKDLEDCFQKGWRGVFVIKPGIFGSPYRLKEFCQSHEIDTVFSSVFETAIGRKAALELAIKANAISKHQSRQRAVGFGINLFLTPHKTLLPTNLGNDLFLFS
jgi:O-succinylbenzoate synthase